MLRNALLLGLAAAALALPIEAAPAPGPAPGSHPVTTPRGAPISLITQYPAGAGPFPAVILAPGTGTLQQKINDTVAAALLAHGFAVYRFDWAWYVKDPAVLPSDTDRAPEVEDLTTVVSLAKADKRIDPARIILGGKSRGTIIGWRVLRADPALKGILELTPVCTKPGFTLDQLYPDLAKETRPSLWISGDVDPACQSRTLYDFLSHAPTAARLDGVRGDHSLEIDSTAALTAALAVDFAQAVTAAKP